jgi:nitroimidazol reductase NimA-like FMN-containing flavoprotein (pyridoxamine 5'-phosphate oxidase superfamily)
MTEKSKPTVRMSEQEIWQFLEQGHTGILTTLRQDGMPIALPIWYVCLDQHIYIGTRGKKLNRISNDPRASLLVEEGKRWSELRAVHMTGKAEIVNLEGDLSARYGAELERKYGGYRTAGSAMPKATREVYAKSVSGVVRFTPDDRVLHWDNRKLGID